MIGLISLIAIIKNDGIRLVDLAIQAARDGLGSEETMAKRQKCEFGPILIATTAALLGAAACHWTLSSD